MLIGKVVGSVVATRKDEKLEHQKLLLVQVHDHHNQAKDQYVVAVDAVGAGMEEIYQITAALKHLTFGKHIAVRIGQLESSSLVAKRVNQVSRVVVASPEYLRRHGTPRKLFQCNACRKQTSVRAGTVTRKCSARSARK